MGSIKNRKVYQPGFKAKVALEAVKGRMTINEIAKEYELHPNQISQWKKQFLESMAGIFENSKAGARQPDEELTSQLYEQIGRLKVELDWLKKNLRCSVKAKRELIEPANGRVSVARQCELLGLNRSTLYYRESFCQRTLKPTAPHTLHVS